MRPDGAAGELIDTLDEREDLDGSAIGVNDPVLGQTALFVKRFFLNEIALSA